MGLRVASAGRRDGRAGRDGIRIRMTTRTAAVVVPMRPVSNHQEPMPASGSICSTMSPAMNDADQDRHEQREDQELASLLIGCGNNQIRGAFRYSQG